MAIVRVEMHPIEPDEWLNLIVTTGNTTTTVCLTFDEADELASDIRKWQGLEE